MARPRERPVEFAHRTSRDQARELVDRYMEAAVAEARIEAAAADPVPALATEAANFPDTPDT